MRLADFYRTQILIREKLMKALTSNLSEVAGKIKTSIA
jgi:hypothetical protein